MASASKRVPLRVLIVDDHEDTRDMYAEFLRSVGNDVRCAEDGETALAGAAAPDWMPDVIVMDWSMPRMSGDEVVRRLKSDPRTRVIPVVMVTAAGLQERARLETAGASAVCAKPCDPTRLLAVIHSVVPDRPEPKPENSARRRRIQRPRRVAAAAARGAAMLDWAGLVLDELTLTIRAAEQARENARSLRMTFARRMIDLQRLAMPRSQA